MARRAHGEGSIKRTEYGRWRVQYWIDGERKSKNFATKGEASAFQARQRIAAERGELLDEHSGSQILRDYAEEWLRHRDLRPTTRGKYRYLLDAHILGELGSKPLNKISPALVRRWYEPKKAKYTSAADDAYRLLRAMFASAVRDKLIADSPCVLEGAGGWKRTKRPTLTLTEVKQAVRAVQPHERTILLLAVFGQLRRGEIAGLQRRDVDLRNGTISIERTWTQSADGKVELGPPKTEAGVRTITLPAIAMDELGKHLDGFTAKEKDAWLFSRNGRPISPRTVDRVWTRVRDKVGRPEVRLHDLRHTGLTLVAQTGATTAELMFRGGHSSPAAALHYQQASKERDKAVAETLNRLATGRLADDVDEGLAPV